MGRSRPPLAQEECEDFDEPLRGDLIPAPTRQEREPATTVEGQRTRAAAASNLRNCSFKRIKARSGVREDLRFHDLRYTCTTLLLREGVNAKVVSEMLGHASIAITLNTSSHVLPDMRDSTVDAMEAALGTIS